MFSEELNMLIEAAIACGEISDKQREILHKRARAEGVDIDELEMILQAKLMNKNKDENVSRDRIKRDSVLKEHLKRMQEIKRQNFKGNIFNSKEDKREEAFLGAIRAFPIPNEKEELLELITFLKPYSTKIAFFLDDDLETEKTKAYKDRYKEACLKVRTKFPNDKELNLVIDGDKKGIIGKLGGLFGKK